MGTGQGCGPGHGGGGQGPGSQMGGRGTMIPSALAGVGKSINRKIEKTIMEKYFVFIRPSLITFIEETILVMVVSPIYNAYKTFIF